MPKLWQTKDIKFSLMRLRKFGLDSPQNSQVVFQIDSILKTTMELENTRYDIPKDIYENIYGIADVFESTFVERRLDVNFLIPSLAAVADGLKELSGMDEDDEKNAGRYLLAQNELRHEISGLQKQMKSCDLDVSPPSYEEAQRAPQPLPSQRRSETMHPPTMPTSSTPQYSSWPSSVPSDSQSDTPRRHSRPYSYVPDESSSRPPRPGPSTQNDARRSTTMPQPRTPPPGPSPPPSASYGGWDYPGYPPWQDPAHIGNHNHIIAGPGSYISNVGNNYHGATIYHGDERSTPTSPGRRQRTI